MKNIDLEKKFQKKLENLKQPKETISLEALAKAFGRAIRELRMERGLSQENVIQLSGNLDRVTFQRYDAGKQVPKMIMLFYIAMALEVDPGLISNRAFKYYGQEIKKNPGL